MHAAAQSLFAISWSDNLHRRDNAARNDHLSALGELSLHSKNTSHIRDAADRHYHRKAIPRNTVYLIMLGQNKLT